MCWSSAMMALMKEAIPSKRGAVIARGRCLFRARRKGQREVTSFRLPLSRKEQLGSLHNGLSPFPLHQSPSPFLPAHHIISSVTNLPIISSVEDCDK